MKTITNPPTRRIAYVLSTVRVLVLGMSVMLVPAGCEPGSSGAGPIPGPATAGNRPITTERNPMAAAEQIVRSGLADPDPRMRANAIEVVATTGQVRLMPNVQRLLRDPAVPVRFLAALAVGDLQYSFAQNDVTELLRDQDENVRIAAAYALLRMGQPEYYTTIRDAIASPDLTVRANAAMLLGKTADQRSLRYLYWALRKDDSDDRVILQTAESIAKLGDERIYEKLWTRLISKYADDRVIGIRAMGALRTAQARNAITTMLEDKVLEVRLAAAQELGRLNDPVGEEEVLEVYQDRLLAEMDPQGRERVKVLTALAIGEIGTEPVKRYLPGLLTDESPVVRMAAAKAVFRTSLAK